MIAIPHMIYFVGLLPVPLAIAATLWLELRRHQRRRRLAQNIQSLLQDEFYRLPERDIDLKKAA